MPDVLLFGLDSSVMLCGYHYFVPFYCWIVLYYRDVPQFAHLFAFRRAFVWFPALSHCGESRMNIRVLAWTICLLLGEHPAAEWLDSTAGACSPLKILPNGFPRWRGSRPRQWCRVSRSLRVLTGAPKQAPWSQPCWEVCRSVLLWFRFALPWWLLTMFSAFSSADLPSIYFLENYLFRSFGCF